jgi:DNA replication initiation complex subunit (GINS family)
MAKPKEHKRPPIKDEEPTSDDVRRVMSMLGKIGGPIGGRARAEALSKKERVLIARRAALARWSKERNDE